MATNSTIRLNQAYDDKEVRYPAARMVPRGPKLVILFALVALLALALGLVIGRFAIPRAKSSEEKLFNALRQEADEDISSKMMDAVDPKNIEEELR